MAILYQDVIAVFDDSFQPTGVEWDGWVPHVKMKKLRHELTLTIEGPDNLSGAVEGCLRDGALAGLLGGVAGSFIGIGLGGTAGAWAAFQAAFIKCAGEQVQMRIDDKSHWIEWLT